MKQVQADKKKVKEKDFKVNAVHYYLAHRHVLDSEKQVTAKGITEVHKPLTHYT